ncbi:MAG TPA: molybdate ABC transporter permease subunit [Bacillota bacterium]|nr:molybdate ABC transporter permease subunit [Bacillota bacterium]
MTFDLAPLTISLNTATIATLITLVLGAFTAYLMAGYSGPGKHLMDGILTLPLVLPPTVVGYFLLLMLGKNGPVGKVLAQLGIVVVFSWPAAVIAAVVVSFPLMYKTILNSLEQIDRSVIEASYTLGATGWQIFRWVTLPLAWPGVITGTMMAFARALGEFGATMMVAGNIPGRTQTMPLAIFFAAETGDMLTALAWVGMISLLSLTVIYSLNLVQREALM